jgi:hypothetical protein
MEYFIGFGVGCVITFIGCMIGCHLSHTKRRVQLEQEYVVLQGHVDQCLASLSRIIEGSRE